jgi:hypothetical protein
MPGLGRNITAATGPAGDETHNFFSILSARIIVIEKYDN